MTIWRTALTSNTHSGARAHLRAVIVTIVLAFVLVGLALWLVPSACHTRADPFVNQWACVLPLSIMYLWPAIALLYPAATYLCGRLSVRRIDGWFTSMALSALAAQLIIGTSMYALAGEYLNYTNLATFLVFPQAMIAGASAGLVYWLALRFEFAR